MARNIKGLPKIIKEQFIADESAANSAIETIINDQNSQWSAPYTEDPNATAPAAAMPSVVLKYHYKGTDATPLDIEVSTDDWRPRNTRFWARCCDAPFKLTTGMDDSLAGLWYTLYGSGTPHVFEIQTTGVGKTIWTLDVDPADGHLHLTVTSGDEGYLYVCVGESVDVDATETNYVHVGNGW